MTTIAYRDGVLAGDSRLTCGQHTDLGAYRKVFKLPDGSLLGWSGEYGTALLVLDALMHDEEIPEYEHGTTCIRVSPKGRMSVYEGDGVWIPQKGQYGAWGSGRAYAYGALHRGATAVQAIQTAKAFDKSNTGGPVRTVRLD